MSTIDQQFIEYIIKSLVGKPEAVKVERRVDEKGVLLELIVDPEDLGRVIGKRGATAQSLRTLLRALGTKNDARYNLKIVDTGPPPERRTDDRDQKTDVHDNTDAKPVKPSKSDDKPTDHTSTASSAVADDEADDDELPESAEVRSHSDVISRTRAELADLDDLEV
jgi:predicted RNA-binding protein YlqC (UPF0109 family)